MTVAGFVPAAALAVAVGAHEGQSDRGVPVLSRLTGPAALLRRLGAADEVVAAAWLRLVVTRGGWSPGALVRAGFPSRVVDAVVALTPSALEGSGGWWGRVVACPDALLVRRAVLVVEGDPGCVGAEVSWVEMVLEGAVYGVTPGEAGMATLVGAIPTRPRV